MTPVRESGTMAAPPATMAAQEKRIAARGRKHELGFAALRWRYRHNPDRGPPDRRSGARRRRDAETGRHADLYDPGRLLAELRRPPRRHLRDGARDRPVLQRADPDQPGEPVIDDRFRVRCMHRDPE